MSWWTSERALDSLPNFCREHCVHRWNATVYLNINTTISYMLWTSLQGHNTSLTSPWTRCSVPFPCHSNNRLMIATWVVHHTTPISNLRHRWTGTILQASPRARERIPTIHLKIATDRFPREVTPSTWPGLLPSNLRLWHSNFRCKASQQELPPIATRNFPWNLCNDLRWLPTVLTVSTPEKGWRTKNKVFVSTLDLSSWHSQWRIGYIVK